MFFDDSDKLTQIEREFYISFDPFAHFVNAELISTGKLEQLKVEFESDDDLPHPLQVSLDRAAENVEKNKKVLVRVLRYFASETLILMLLASPPHVPFFRVASTLKNHKLNKMFKALSEGEIPEDFGIKIKDIDIFDFETWLGQKMFRDNLFFKNPETLDFIKLIKEEALLLSQRGAINAFKHCRPLGFGKSLAGKVLLKSSKGPIATILPTSGIQWIEWRETMGKQASISTITEEFDEAYDRARLFQVCLIMDSLRRQRVAELEGKKVTDVCLPKIKKLKGKLHRSSHQTTFSMGR